MIPTLGPHTSPPARTPHAVPRNRFDLLFCRFDLLYRIAIKFLHIVVERVVDNSAA